MGMFQIKAVVGVFAGLGVFFVFSLAALLFGGDVKDWVTLHNKALLYVLLFGGMAIGLIFDWKNREVKKSA